MSGTSGTSRSRTGLSSPASARSARACRRQPDSALAPPGRCRMCRLSAISHIMSARPATRTRARSSPVKTIRKVPLIMITSSAVKITVRSNLIDGGR
ncbi:hypothetical protein ACFYUV_48775 [Nonomuraea sp. NPDC003560]|uniref:hypothetical protein n=1 Tax=Nonomuraea sp. NPDC003560 TaxID=3364341 RepID=UPI003689A010